MQTSVGQYIIHRDVANGIRDLANKSSETVKDIEDIINHTLKVVQSAQTIVSNTDTALTNISTTIEDTVSISTKLLENTNVQKESIAALQDGTRQLSRMADTNVTSSHENSAISEKMLTELGNLRMYSDR